MRRPAPDPATPEILLHRQSSSSRRRPAVMCVLLAAAADEVILQAWPSASAGSNEVGVGGLFSNSGRRWRAWSSVEGERRDAGARKGEGRRPGSWQGGGGGGGREVAREEENEVFFLLFLDDTAGLNPPT
jgi:hypothetical protein